MSVANRGESWLDQIFPRETEVALDKAPGARPPGQGRAGSGKLTAVNSERAQQYPPPLEFHAWIDVRQSITQTKLALLIAAEDFSSWSTPEVLGAQIALVVPDVHRRAIRLPEARRAAKEQLKEVVASSVSPSRYAGSDKH